MAIDRTELDGPRPCRPSEVEALIALTDRVFRPNGPTSMGDEFPVYLSAAQVPNCWIFAHGDTIVSHFGVEYKQLLIDDATLDVGLVGAVATDEAYRGMGLATALMDAAVADARRRHVGLFLISGGRGLYTRQGARHTGRIARFRLPAALWESLRNPAIAWRPATPADAELIVGWYAHQNPRFVRATEALRPIVTAECCGLKVFIAQRGDTPIGYACATFHNDRIDVGELGGCTDIIGVLGALAPENFSGDVDLRLSAHDTLFVPHLDAMVEGCTRADGSPCREVSTFGGTLFFTDFPLVIRALLPYWRTHGLENLQAGQDGNTCLLTDTVDAVTLDAPAMVEFLWGAPDAPAPPVRWQAALPLPLCPYGLDFI
jgi:predicted N-acetyltransferase YhbS